VIIALRVSLSRLVPLQSVVKLMGVRASRPRGDEMWHEV
jgi:hypothetical protein